MLINFIYFCFFANKLGPFMVNYFFQLLKTLNLDSKDKKNVGLTPELSTLSNLKFLNHV